ncbi:UNVERIFIED_CONTAM: hypothetical protein HDU68_007099 [Siphonaria sp. JEL0065]|nr:hypothetical protein HDU68_007099 [Siphonaria sp. JEL0065]
MCDILWSDPKKFNIEDEPGSGVFKGWGANDRGTSWVFGENVVKKFTEHHGLELIVRGHQAVEDGYEFFASKRLVTIFSSPNYNNDFENIGAVLKIDINLNCSIKCLVPQSKTNSTSLPPQHQPPGRRLITVVGRGGQNELVSTDKQHNAISEHYCSARIFLLAVPRPTSQALLS